VLGILLKQLDTAEGIVALTALLALAKDFFITGKKESGGRAFRSNGAESRVKHFKSIS